MNQLDTFNLASVQAELDDIYRNLRDGVPPSTDAIATVQCNLDQVQSELLGVVRVIGDLTLPELCHAIRTAVVGTARKQNVAPDPLGNEPDDEYGQLFLFD